MGQTYQNEVAILQEFYGKLIQDSVNNEVELKKWLEQSTREHDGLRYNFPLHSKRNTAVGFRQEGGLLPTAGQQSWASVYVTSAYVYGKISLTGQAIKASKKTAWVEAKSAEMEGLKNDVVKQLSRASYGCGQAVLARVGASADTSTLYLLNRFNKPGFEGARYLDVDQKINVGNFTSWEGSAADKSGVIVVSIAQPANSATTYDTVVVSGTVTTSATCYVFSFLDLASTATAPRGIEIKGLRCLVDDTTQTCSYAITGGYFGAVSIFNVSRDGVKNWNAFVDQNSGTERVLDNFTLQRALSSAKKKVGKKEVDILFGEYDTIDAFLDSVIGDRRFASKEFDAGASTLTWNGKPLVKDSDAPYDELFGLVRDSLNWYVMQDLAFDDTDGNVMKNVDGYDKFEAFMGAYLQLGPGEGAPLCSNFAIRDIKTRL